MNAFRKTSLFVLVAFVAVLALGLTVSSAEAGGCHNSYGYHSVGYPSYSNYGSYGNYGSSYGPSCYAPSYEYVARPISYPVTYYDCYGRPYIVWQTSYSYLP